MSPPFLAGKKIVQKGPLLKKFFLIPFFLIFFFFANHSHTKLVFYFQICKKNNCFPNTRNFPQALFGPQNATTSPPKPIPPSLCKIIFLFLFFFPQRQIEKKIPRKVHKKSQKKIFPPLNFFFFLAIEKNFFVTNSLK